MDLHAPPLSDLRNRAKVMVVEDEALLALDIHKQLIQTGFAVTGSASTAAQAFQMIERETPDIILMGIKLKGDMDGVQAASIIRSRYALPVIYLTSLSDEATLDHARATQPYGFFLKPFARFGMAAAITMAVHKHRTERKHQALFQKVMATGTAVRIPFDSGLVAKLLDVTGPKRYNPAQPHDGPSTSTGERMIVLLCLPGKKPEPAGILVIDHGSDHLAVKLKTNVEIEDEIVSAFWKGLALDLNQKSQSQGGIQVVEWLEETASYIVRLSPRAAVDLKTTTPTEALDQLYREHIVPSSSCIDSLSAQA